MRTAIIVAVVTALFLVADASAQNQGTASGLGKVNPFTPQFKMDPITGALSPTQPFTSEPNHLNNAYPTEPWNQLGVGRIDYGQVVQYITVPSQQATVTLYVPGPDGVPPQTREDAVEIPGYYVTETTTGYWYPERWALQQLNVGVYQWVKLRPSSARSRRAPR